MSVKQVKVDNWGIYFLQRLKHFFNRTDYCDLTLQFQDNAQLKVHRLVLSACTEYFELLERTCEMYEDCLVMPDDLQADVVVPIVNFMYTGQLEFRMDLLERLFQTSQIMNMPVLTKLLEAHRSHIPKPALSYNTPKRSYSKSIEYNKSKPTVSTGSTSNNSSKRAYTKAFGGVSNTNKEKKQASSSVKTVTNSGMVYVAPMPAKKDLGEPRPTRYELPEELDTDNIFDNSFTNISYTSQPLMVHPDSSKKYIKKTGLFSEPSSSKGPSTLEIVECKKITRNENIFEDEPSICEEPDMYSSSHLNIKSEGHKDSSQLFDQIIDHDDMGPKVTIETKDSQQSSNIDHAKIISEVLKKYPHLVKSNKNIKLKILNTPSKPKVKRPSSRLNYSEEKEAKTCKTECPDFTYETDVLDSKEAAKLIAMGAENIKGPWICLICGTPGRALHFTSYYKFRRHLVEVHNEKPVSNICEYCGLKSLKRNYLLHHLYTKHGVDPPPSYHFPKCNLCNYVALTEGFLVKHKLSHSENRSFRCNVCAAAYNSSSQLLAHIQNTGHKYSADRRTNLQCIYCLKVFLRESNLYAHLKTHHKEAAKSDGIIDDSDEEKQEERKPIVKHEPPTFEPEYETEVPQYQIRPDGNIELVNKKPRTVTSTPTKQKILNAGFDTPTLRPTQKQKPVAKTFNARNDLLENVSITPNIQNEEIVMIDNNEYVMRDNQLIPKRRNNTEYILSDMMDPDKNNTLTSSPPLEFTHINETMTNDIVTEQKMIIKKSGNINQPIQIVVSNEEEYKALINSNHSIIFDDGESNKTLTVLSAPHNPTVNTTSIDLDNTQPGDMMIIQDNYPLNVSEAVQPDNSNIVVVYSHPMDNQSKPYQLISSQSLEAQFVQSSAVVTQNYETITTTTPVMSAHVIDTPETDSWQNNVESNIHNQQEDITTANELQQMAIVEQSEMANESESANILNDLPEVTLTSIPQEASVEEIETVGTDIVQSVESACLEKNIEDSMEQVTEEETQNVSSESMEVDAPIEAEEKEDSNVDTVNEITNTTEPSIQNEPVVETPVINENELEESIITADTVTEVIQEPYQGPTEEEQNDDETNMQTECVTTVVDEEPNNCSEQTETAEEVIMSNEEANINKEPPVQIQSLTSEWSEDEYDTEEHPQNDAEQNNKTVCESQSLITEISEDVEESIENIQQEMEKQMTEVVEGDTEESLNSSQDENVDSTQEQEPSQVVVVQAPQEKISSLLNDWEDNDSQEGNEKNDTNKETVDSNGPLTKEDVIDEKSGQEDDKIKSLVSDWDDDDEEIKS